MSQPASDARRKLVEKYGEEMVDRAIKEQQQNDGANGNGVVKKQKRTKDTTNTALSDTIKPKKTIKTNEKGVKNDGIVKPKTVKRNGAVEGQQQQKRVKEVKGDAKSEKTRAKEQKELERQRVKLQKEHLKRQTESQKLQAKLDKGMEMVRGLQEQLCQRAMSPFPEPKFMGSY